MGSANFVDAKLADRGFTSRVNALSYSSRFAAVASYCGRGEQRSRPKRKRRLPWPEEADDLDRIFAPVDALAQISCLAYGFEGRPIWPSTDSIAMFATAQTVVEDESPSTGGRDANTETTRCFRALIKAPAK